MDITTDRSVSAAGDGPFLVGVRVLEMADELGEYCGKLLAGLGADVIKVEPPGGEVTRSYGPFYEDEPHHDRSLHFWDYNFAKRGIVLDLDADEGRRAFVELVKTADVVVDARPRNYLGDRGLGFDELRQLNPALVYTRITAFGDDGPWADYHGSDLIHLALGGVMMNCGYDPDPTGFYDTPPIAPQMWHAYHITGEVTAFQIIAALRYARRTGQGQQLMSSVHDAVSKNTESDVPNWIFARQTHLRQTGRHSLPFIGVSQLARTKDGRWMLPYRTYLPVAADNPGIDHTVLSAVEILKEYDAQYDLEDPKYANAAYVHRPEVDLHISAVLEQFIGSFPFSADLWKLGQTRGQTWGPLRKPEENLDDEHWVGRETFVDVEYPELGRTFTQVRGKWVAPGAPWAVGPRAPLLDEHTAEVLAELQARDASRDDANTVAGGRPQTSGIAVSEPGNAFALDDVKVIDLSWFLATGGAGRFLAAHGAEVIKVEHSSRPDAMRFGTGLVGPGGRDARRAATAPIEIRLLEGEMNRSGTFLDINAGKRHMSLNLKDDEGKAILRELLTDADVVLEGFSPGTMERWGFGYDVLREINPRLVYVQQSGMGQVGTYGAMRTFGPTAQGFSGLSEMSGMPDPWAPAGFGYSYLDWFGAYQVTLAVLAALFRRQRTGRGCWVDASQVESGIYLTGVPVLDKSANDRSWSRVGNRSPWKTAAPHGAFRTEGDDRWIAIAAFSDEHWRAIVSVLARPEWLQDPKLSTKDQRLRYQDYLEGLMNEACSVCKPYELMESLQRAGVPAGVCQTAADRVEHDPQLRHLEWLVELDQTEIGRWPAKDVPVKFSLTPPRVGGPLYRHGPNYGEDTDYVMSEILGRDAGEIARLRAAGVL